MATELLATGTTEANSADFTLAAGESATLFLKGLSGPKQNTTGLIAVTIKDSAGAYWPIATMSALATALVVQAVGTYRVTRAAIGYACGVDRG